MDAVQRIMVKLLQLFFLFLKLFRVLLTQLLLVQAFLVPLLLLQDHLRFMRHPTDEWCNEFSNKSFLQVFLQCPYFLQATLSRRPSWLHSARFRSS